MATKQSQEALRQANHYRECQMLTKRALTAGELTVREALERQCMENVGVNVVLGALPRWGPARSRKALAAILIRENRPCGQLTARQRARIVEQLDDLSRTGAWTW